MTDLTEQVRKENARLKKQINHLLKTQARQFADNQKLQVKAEKAKDVVNIDTARQIKQLKELLKECVELMDSTGAIAMHIDVYRQRKKDVLNAISQVLGEDK